MRRFILPILGSLVLVAVSCSVVNAPDDPQLSGSGGSGASGGGQGATGGGSCGTCEPAHALDPTCTDGTCGYGSCDTGYQDCDDDTANGCESAKQSDPEHCGSCDASCAAAPFENVDMLTCTDGMCGWVGCAQGFGDCNMTEGDGCEEPVDTLVDCGDCGVPCTPMNATGPTCDGGNCDYGMCMPGFKDCDTNTANGCESPPDDAMNCQGCNQPCNMNEVCSGGMCTTFRPNVYVCGQCTKNVSEFFPPQTSFQIINSCSPDNNVQAMFVTRYASGLNAASVQGYLQNGGIILTEHSFSDDVFSLAFQTVPQGPTFLGGCQDTIPMVVQFSPGDAFWQNNPFIQMAIADTGCGFAVQGFPGITPIAGWDAVNVSVAYRELGQGRLWLVDVDWQDSDMAAFEPQTNAMMGYMMTHK